MDKERAKRIILEIIRANGGSLTNKTNLFKAFYHAHLKYAENHSDVLSSWPIVRMPRGPGIDDFDTLIGELLHDGLVHIDSVQVGSFEAMQFTVTDKGAEADDTLSEDALKAIAEGVNEVDGKTAAQVSHASHQRAWENEMNGREMNVYLDLIPDDEYAAGQERIAKLAAAFRKACG